MVDWNRVEKLRSKGLDWETIADDEKVEFTPPQGVSDAGKALKALYYSKKSTKAGSAGSRRSKAVEKEKHIDWRLALLPVGLCIVVLGLLWFAFAYENSLVGFLVPAIPYVLLVTAAGAILLAASFVLATGNIREIWKKPVAIGIVLGLMIPGSIALYDGVRGVPSLSGNTISEPGGWESEYPRNSPWTSNGLPVYFFMGSIACPYCSASSWAMYQAFNNVGTLTGEVTGTSNPGDVDPNTPEMEFVNAQLSSNYISLDVKEGNDDFSTAVMPPLSIVEQAYVATYDSDSGIPLVVIGGMFIHVNTLVDPTVLKGLSPAQVKGILADPGSNPTVYDAIHDAQLYIEAYIVKACEMCGVSAPTFGNGDEPSVMSIVHLIQ